MAYYSGPRKQSRMVADREEPWISVSLLAEYVYCPRAGIIQHESAEEDTGEEQDRHHAGRSRAKAFYTIHQIRRELERLQKILLGVFIGLAVALLGSMILPILQLVVFIIILALLYFGFQWLDVYFGHYLKAKISRGFAPDPVHTEPQPIQWWNLVNSGFDVVRPQDQYRDVQWHLAGRPWRVLRKGDLRIPVYKKKLRRTGEERLFKQHFVRMAAYCHLLEKCEGASSPYGVVLFGDTLQGRTVPYNPGSKKTFHDHLVGARKLIANLGYAPNPPAPTNRPTCLNCPHSKHDRFTASACSTRFNWVAPNSYDEKRLNQGRY